MKTITFIFVLVTSFNVYAQSRAEDLKYRINQLANRISDTVHLSNATTSELEEVDLQLQRSLRTLRGTGGGSGNTDREACIKFAFDNYNRTLNSASAMDKASIFCRDQRDLAVASTLYNYANKTLNGASAMDLVAKYSGYENNGKSQLASYLCEKYNITLNGASTVESAGRSLSKLRTSDLSCLQTAFENYNRSLNAANAMDKAVTSCSRY